MKKLYYSLFLSIIMLTFISCFHEYPDETEAVDPTEVQINLEVSIDFATNPFIKQTRTDDIGFRRRFIVDVYKDDDISKPVERKEIIFDDIKSDGESFRLPVLLMLKPLNYKIVVWTDYIKSGTDKDYFYDTTTLSDVYCTSPYQGNTAYKDVFYATEELNLLEYNGKWNQKLTLFLQFERAVSPIRLLATDYENFVEKHGSDIAENAKITLNYGFYIPKGFNALTGLPQRSELGTSFTVPLQDATQVDEGLQIVSDYIFVGEEETFAVVDIEITDKDGNLLNQVKNIKVPYKKDYLTTIKNSFLTSEQSSGIDVDVEFDEDIVIDLDK